MWVEVAVARCSNSSVSSGIALAMEGEKTKKGVQRSLATTDRVSCAWRAAADGDGEQEMQRRGRGRGEEAKERASCTKKLQMCRVPAFERP